MEYKKYISKYINNNYLVLVPVFYEHETAPAWRKYFIGTRDECENALDAAPDYLNATADENATNRHYKRLEYIYLLEHGNAKKAGEIKKQYQL